MRFRSRLARRPAIALLFVLVALFLGGCVYLRLLELKHQFAHFDRYFQVDYTSGLKLSCQEPVLLDEDLGFFKLVPEKREPLGTAERWHFRWIKANAVPGEDPRNYEVTADFLFSQHKLARVILPERLFAFFPKPLFVGLLRSLGNAKIDREKRSATSSFAASDSQASLAPMTQDQVIAMLGVPFEKNDSAQGEEWRYRYKKATPDQRSGSIDVVLLFNGTDHRMTRMKGRIFDATVDFAFPPATAAPTAPPLPEPAKAP